MTDNCKILTQLTIDPYLCQAYARDPELALAHLGSAARELLASGPSATTQAWDPCVTCSDPGPDPMPGDGADDGEVDSVAVR